MEDKKVPEKILKLLSKLKELADPSKNSNEYEAAVAAGKIQKLLLEYNLTEQDITSESQGVKEVMVILPTARPETWTLVLMNSVCSTFYCSALNHGKGVYGIIGSEADSIAAKFTFEYLYETVVRLAERYVNSNNTHEHKRTVRVSYCLGAAGSIKRTLRQMKEGNEKSATSQQENGTNNAIVLMSQSKLKHIEEYMNQQYPNSIKVTKPISANSGRAYYQGKEDGAKVNVAKGGINGNSNKYLGS